MRPSQASLLKISLSGADRICGCCQHASRYEVAVSGEEHALLKQAAKTFFEIHNDNIVIPTEIVWRLLAFYNRLGSRDLYCSRQRCRTKLSDSCALWRSRETATENPLTTSTPRSDEE